METKGYINPLRQVHLALVVLSLAILIRADVSPSYQRAREQLKELRDVTKDWANRSSAWARVDDVAGAAGPHIALLRDRPEMRTEPGFRPYKNGLLASASKTVSIPIAGQTLSFSAKIAVNVPPVYVPRILESTRGTWLDIGRARQFWTALGERFLVVADVRPEEARVTIRREQATTDSPEALMAKLEIARKVGLNLTGDADILKRGNGYVARASPAVIAGETDEPFPAPEALIDRLEAEVEIPVVMVRLPTPVSCVRCTSSSRT